MAKLARKMKERLGTETKLKAAAQRAWDTLSSPIIVPDGRILINPKSFQASAINGTDRSINLSVGMVARPELQVAPYPILPLPEPLPPLQITPPGNAVHLALEATVPYSRASAELVQHLGKESIAIGSRKVQVTNAQVYPAGDRLIVAVDLTGKVQGKVYFTGKLGYDPVTAKLFVRELDYELNTRGVLAKIADWLLHDSFRNRIQAAAEWTIQDRLAEVTELVRKAINRETADAVLSGTVTILRPLGPVIHAQSVGVRIVADGAIQIKLK